MSWRWIAIFILAGATALGEESDKFFTDDLFRGGAHELTLTSGVMFSPFVADKGRPGLNYTMSELQFGWMLNNIHDAGWIRGNFEFAADGFGGAIVKGRGNYLAGATGLLRYNWVPKQSRFVPFAQVGLGFTFTDLDRRLEGQTFNFNLNLGGGVRWFIAPNWSANLEYRYQHISNADLSHRNLGVNSEGPIAGVSWYF